MYQVILESGHAPAACSQLAHDARTISRNLVALEDAYGYRIIAGHPSIDHDAAAELILDYARVATGHPLVPTEATTRMTGASVTASLTVLFLPESAHGPTNQCIGLGKVLLDRGHRVVFAAERSWEGKLAPLGFVEALVDLAPRPGRDPDAAEEAAGQFWIDFINETVAGVPQADRRAADVVRAADLPGAHRRREVLRAAARAIIAEHRPDVLVEDNVVAFPALLTSGAPFVRIVSCNPLEVRGDGVAAGVLRATPAADRTRLGRRSSPSSTAPTRRRGTRSTRGCRSRAPRRCRHRDFIHTSERRQPLRLPGGARLRRRPAARRRPGTGSTPACARPTSDFVLPEAFADRPEGCGADLPVARLARRRRHRPAPAAGRPARHHPHRVVVSMGPRADEIRLADNMVGDRDRAADQGHPAGRPGHHPRRQQHHHRVACTSASR